MQNINKIKCLVWDLDNTLWNRTLLEDKEVFFPQQNLNIIKELDKRGILQSIASKNDFDLVVKKLDEFGIKDFFLYPQINWNTKSSSIQKIAESINIGIDSLGFIDDQSFEREEVNFHHPEVFCIDAKQIGQLLKMPELKPHFITNDSKKRRLLYLNDIKRNEAEEKFRGPSAEFLSTLNMSFKISLVKEGDLERVEELTVRTNQLNTTGYTYSFDELQKYSLSKDYLMFIPSLDDNFGTYGKIGLSLIKCEEKKWTIKLLLMSCRVMSRGVGNMLLFYIMKMAKENNVRLEAEFVPTDRNRMMFVTYKFAGFEEVEEKDNIKILHHNLNTIPSYPDYIKLNIDC